MPTMKYTCASYRKHLFVSVMGNICANYWEHPCQLWVIFVPIMGNIFANYGKYLYTNNILVTMF